MTTTTWFPKEKGARYPCKLEGQGQGEELELVSDQHCHPVTQEKGKEKLRSQL